MSGNIFGKMFRVVTFGESHGPYIGVVIDGIQPNLPIDAQEIQSQLNRRRPGQSKVVTPRSESDSVRIISGVFEGKTTGTPLCMLIRNEDQRPKDYSQIKNILRPGHAGFTFLKKYGIFDYRGGGRASGRETATRVAAGAVARQFLNQRGVEIIGYTRQIGSVRAEKVDFQEIDRNPVRSPDKAAALKMVKAIENARREKDSLGGVVEIVVKNCPAGLGEPVFHKLEADLAAALMSIGAVKGFEMGSGFAAAELKGSENNDLFWYDPAQERFATRTNNAGGTLGGISNGENLVMRIAVKPPSSIGKKQETVDGDGKPVTLQMGGRHDPCICPRVVPVAEAMVALVLIDHLLMQERIQNGDSLEFLRQQIDTIDTEMLLLLARRQQITRKIGKLKQETKLPIPDEAREQYVRQNWNEFGGQLGLKKQVINALVKNILDSSKVVQAEEQK